MTARDPRDIAYGDQVAAAVREASNVFAMTSAAAQVATGPGATPGPLPAAGRELADRHLSLIADGKGTHCGHLDTGQPQPYTAAAWDLGFTACVPCTEVGALTPPPGTGDLCDYCGRHVGPYLTAGGLQNGPLVFLFCLCPHCAGLLPDDVPLPDVPTPTPRVQPLLRPYRPGMNRAARRRANRKGGRR